MDRCFCGKPRDGGRYVVAPAVLPPRVRDAGFLTPSWDVRAQRAYEAVLEDIYDEQRHPWCGRDACVGEWGRKVDAWRAARDKELERLGEEYAADVRASHP